MLAVCRRDQIWEKEFVEMKLIEGGNSEDSYMHMLTAYLKVFPFKEEAAIPWQD